MRVDQSCRKADMAKSKSEFASVNDYIASHPKAAQAILRRVRTAIRKAAPDAEETISYNLPTYKLYGRPLIYFAGWKQHYSLYPFTQPLLDTFKGALAPHAINKGTIRFALSEPVPVTLIERIVKFRTKELAQREKVPTMARKKR
jgi:uncharacterized protein YdhG (YjbR/CyaY superfamily)